MLAHLLLLILTDNGISAVALDTRSLRLLVLLLARMLVASIVAVSGTLSAFTLSRVCRSDAKFSILPIFTRDDLRGFKGHFRNDSRCGSAKVTLSPVREAGIGARSSLLGSGRVGVSSFGLLVDGLDLVLGSGCLGVTHHLVVLLVSRIELPGSEVRGCTGHLLSHGLLETASTLVRHLEGSLGLLRFFSSSFLGHDVDAWLPESSLNIWLPLGKVELIEHLWLSQKLLAATAEDLDHIVHFDALVKH